MEFIQTFQKEDWTKRLSKSQYLRQKYPGRVPVIVDRGNPQTPHLSNNRFIVPLDVTRDNISSALTMGEFMYIVRKHIPTLQPEQALFMFLHDKNTLPPTSATLSQIYADYQSKDGFLYLTVSVEAVFGGTMSKQCGLK